jgi:hypothetical protein
MARVKASLAHLRGIGKTGEGLHRWTPADRVEICWFIQTYRDCSRLERTLARLRKIYDDPLVLVVSDGDENPELEPVCRRHGARFARGARLFGVERGGEPVLRMLSAFLETDASCLIKIDPDTVVRRRLTILPPPTDRAVYGTVQLSSDGVNRLESVQGGCIIIPRQAALLLASSGLLESDRLKPPALEWAVGDLSVARAAAGLTSHDWTLGWACRELTMPALDHPEVFSRYVPNLLDVLVDWRAAVCHPRFEVRQLVNPAFYFSGLRKDFLQALRG